MTDDSKVHVKFCPVLDGGQYCACSIIELVRDDQRMMDIDLKLADTNMVAHFQKRLELAYREGALHAQRFMLKYLNGEHDNLYNGPQPLDDKS